MIEIMYKGVFWYNPTEHGLICKKVACDESGVTLEETEYSSKSGDNFNHKAEWAKLPKSETGGHPYNYYPRGRVEIQKKKVTIYLTPVLDTESVTVLINSLFELCNIDIPIKIVPDGSEHYKYLMDYTPRICNMCGNRFDFWDEQEDFSFQRYIGYGSRYDFSHIDICLCCDCFDKVMDWLLPQCRKDPLSDYDVYVPKEE